MNGAIPTTAEEWRLMMQPALRSTVDYNRNLCKERYSSRGIHYEASTQRLQFPQAKVYRADASKTKVGKYPYQCLDGQKFDGKVKRYSQDRFKSLWTDVKVIPSRKPIYKVHPHLRPREEIEREERLRELHQQAIREAEEARQEAEAQAQKEMEEKKRREQYEAMMLLDICAICQAEETRENADNVFLMCSNCKSQAHPKCVEISPELEKVIRGYPWQCMECKTCMECHKADDEDNFMFCDECDRGYHVQCVGLKALPTGRWICDSCGKCASCGANEPGGGNARWKHEFTKPKDSSTKPSFLQTLCVSCSYNFRNDEYCPLCLKVYKSSNEDDPMICCDDCDRWIHIECDNITEEKYETMADEPYSCPICRGTAKERVSV